MGAAGLVNGFVEGYHITFAFLQQISPHLTLQNAKH